MNRFGTRIALGVMVGLAVTLVWGLYAPRAAEEPKDAALERTRRQVRMLDDLYKTAVVLITDHYVDDVSDTAAGEIARDLFAAMKEKGWHEARLVDGTGKPVSQKNVPRDDFERAAIAKMKAGEKYYEEVTGSGDKRVLRAATIVPVVMEKCIICHPGTKKGDLLGAISYKLSVE
jgi:hypothetical protein